MWPKAARIFPVCFFGEIIPLCFDCWPADYERWEHLFRQHDIKTAFFTARQSQEYFIQKLPGLKCYWLPEAADPEEYPFSCPLNYRETNVLELGRRFAAYHDSIRKTLRKAGYVHVYSRSQKRIFPTREDLMIAWGRTQVSVCFPKSMSSPESSGGVETVTFRYFESLASRCLIVGHCPDELEVLFGYNPVIEVDWEDPAGQIINILDNIQEYQKFVERNHQRMLEVGSWDTRVKYMVSILESDGYAI
jgi:hypothetical protein